MTTRRVRWSGPTATGSSTSRYVPHLLVPRARSWLSLTDTERAVVHLAAQGLASRVVADRRRLPQPTVRSHLRRVLRKLGVQSRVELARVIEQGAAQARSMAAVDDTRRRIERDLHDGLQQRLVALGLQVRGRGFVPAADAVLKWELTRAAEGPLILARGSFRSDVLGQFGSPRDSGCTGKISSHEPVRDTGPLLQR